MHFFIILRCEIFLHKTCKIPAVQNNLKNSLPHASNNQKVCVFVYIDLKSVFNTIWVEGLVYKLIEVGIRGNMINYIENYFKNLKIKVFYSGETSEPYKIQTGTPQEPHYLIFYSNVCFMIYPRVYADGITMTCVSTDPNEIKDKLNTYLKDFLKLTEDCGLLLNVRKAMVQHFTRKRIR